MPHTHRHTFSPTNPANKLNVLIKLYRFHPHHSPRTNALPSPPHTHIYLYIFSNKSGKQAKHSHKTSPISPSFTTNIPPWSKTIHLDTAGDVRTVMIHWWLCCMPYMLWKSNVLSQKYRPPPPPSPQQRFDTQFLAYGSYGEAGQLSIPSGS